MGAPGSGHVAKLLNNFLNAISLAATAEVMVAAKQSGLDLAQFLDVVNHSSGVNFATLNRFPRIIEGDYLEGGLTSALMAKDVRLYLEHVQEIGAPSLTGAGVPRRVRARRGARLRRPDQQSRGRRDRRHRRRRPRPAGSEDKPMRIAKGRAGAPSEERGPTFTGRVWADPVLGAGDGIMVANVFFEPGSRTHWHTHEVAQVLHVIAGEGRVQSRDGTGWTLRGRRHGAHPRGRGALARRRTEQLPAAPRGLDRRHRLARSPSATTTTRPPWAPASSARGRRPVRQAGRRPAGQWCVLSTWKTKSNSLPCALRACRSIVPLASR